MIQQLVYRMGEMFRRSCWQASRSLGGATFLLACFVIPTLSSAAPWFHESTLLPDPGFESGSLGGPFLGAASGSLTLDSTVAHTGASSLRLDAAGNNAFTFLWQNFSSAARTAVDGEESFVFSAWVRTAPAASPVQVKIHCLDSNYANSPYQTTATFNPGATWEQISVSYNCPANTPYASFRVFVLQGGTTAWWDDLRFDRVDAPGSNLLGNGGFEAAPLTGPFQTVSNGTLAIDTQALTGQFALRMTAAATDQQTQPYKDNSEAAVVALPPSGAQLEFSAWAKADAGSVPVQLSVFCLDENYAEVTQGLANEVASTSWQKFSISHSCPAGNRFASVQLEVDGAGNTVWWDELWLASDPHFINRLLDPGFESNQLALPFQTASNGTLSLDNSTALTGSLSLELAASTNDAFTQPYEGSSSAALLPISDPSEYLTFVAWARADAAAVPIQMHIFCLDASYNLIPSDQNFLDATANTQWTRFELGHKCGPGAEFASVRLDVDEAGRTVWWDALELSSSSGAFPSPPTSYTHVAVADGPWQSAATWQGGQIPVNDAVVHIPSGRTVTLDHQESARHRFLRVDGSLVIDEASDTRLLVETLYVSPIGSLLLGTPSNRLDTTRSAEIVFIGGSSFDLTWDPGQASRGLISDGMVKLYGAEKTAFVTMTQDALAGDTSLTVDVDLEATGANWQPGDEIVLTGTYFRRGQASRDEHRVIQSVSGNQIVLDQALTYDHVRADNTFALHVGNLTRNVLLRSEAPTPRIDRGHVMIRNRDADIRHVAFVDLGRTNKAFPLGDVIVELEAGGSVDDCLAGLATPEETFTGRVQKPNPAQVTNTRGRYSLHFHLNGTDPTAATPPSLVHDSVVVRTPGWGFVNHSSHVDFRRNIVYDFVGAGFVTEAGDELGNFIDNLAIRGTGDGDFRKARLVFQNCERPQPLSDFAFSGDGFWFQGPAIRANGNIANGCNGAGMIWFTTGAPDIADIDPSDSRNNYVGFPESALQPVYGDFTDFLSFEGRRWNHALDRVVISDLPILECNGFESYANFIGFKLRFNNLHNNSWYQDAPFEYDDEILPIPGAPNNFLANRMREKVSNLVLWNNEQSLRGRYVSKTDFEHVTVANRLIHSNNPRSISGVELRDFVGDSVENPSGQITVTDLTIDGYSIANWIKPPRRSQVDQLTPSTYLNSTMGEDYFPFSSNPCPNVGSLTVDSTTSNSVALSWTQAVEHLRYVIRYWASGDTYINFAETNSSSVTLNGLEANTTYNYQVAAGCLDLPSAAWTLTQTVNTDP